MIVTTITPRVSETDGAGHINNTVIPVWLEAGRREIFALFTPDLGFEHWGVALVNMNVDYVEQTYWQRPVEVRTWLDRIGNTSFRLYEEIWQGETLCVKGTATYVHFDYGEQRPKPVPADIAARLREHARPSDPAT